MLSPDNLTSSSANTLLLPHFSSNLINIPKKKSFILSTTVSSILLNNNFKMIYDFFYFDKNIEKNKDTLLTLFNVLDEIKHDNSKLDELFNSNYLLKIYSEKINLLLS